MIIYKYLIVLALSIYLPLNVPDFLISPLDVFS